jgi:hypothetical protein
MISKENCIKFYCSLAGLCVGLSLLPMFIRSDGNSIPSGSNIEIAAHSIEFNNALVFSFAVAIPLLVNVIADITFHKYVKGTTFSVLVILAIVIPNFVVFFNAIPMANYKLIMSMYYVRWSLVLFCIYSFIAYYGHEVFSSPILMLSALICCAGGMCRVFTIAVHPDHGPALDLVRLILLALGNIGFIWMTIRWLCHCKHSPLNRHTLDTYYCNVYVLSIYFFMVGLWIVQAAFPCKHWYDRNTILISAQIYVFSAFLVMLLVCQGRAARMEFALSKVLI